MNGNEVSTEPARPDLDYVHAFLTASSWSPGIERYARFGFGPSTEGDRLMVRHP